MNIKTKILTAMTVLALVIGISTITTGCKSAGSSASGGTNSVTSFLDGLSPELKQELIDDAQIGAYAAASAELQSNPSSLPDFQLAIGGVNSLIVSSNYNPAAINTLLQPMIAKIKDPTARLAANVAMMKWNKYAGRIVPAQYQAVLLPIWTTIRDGLQQAVNDAIANPPAPKAPKAPKVPTPPTTP